MKYVLYFRIVKLIGSSGYSKDFTWSYGGTYDTPDNAVRNAFDTLPNHLFQYRVVDEFGSVVLEGENY